MNSTWLVYAHQLILQVFPVVPPKDGFALSIYNSII
jgi:hypothetical protein